MIFRSGVNRRQVPQLKADLENGVDVLTLSRAYEVMPEVVFDFAEGWGIKLEETPESLELQKHKALIEAEVRRRVAEALAKEKTKAPETKTSIARTKESD